MGTFRMILIFDGTEFYKEIMEKKILLNLYLRCCHLLIMYFLLFVAIY